MAETQIRQSTLLCPECGVALKEVWRFVPDGGITGGQEWRQAGHPTCPRGHRLDWTAEGQPVQFQ